MACHRVESQREIKAFGIGFCNETDPCYAGFPAGLNQRCNDLFSYTLPAVFRKDDKILDIAIRYAIREYPPHPDRMSLQLIDRYGKNKTPPYEGEDPFWIIFIFPPSPRPVEMQDLGFIPCIYEPDGYLPVHKRPLVP